MKWTTEKHIRRGRERSPHHPILAFSGSNTSQGQAKRPAFHGKYIDNQFLFRARAVLFGCSLLLVNESYSVHSLQSGSEIVTRKHQGFRQLREQFLSFEGLHPPLHVGSILFPLPNGFLTLSIVFLILTLACTQPGVPCPQLSFWSSIHLSLIANTKPRLGFLAQIPEQRESHWLMWQKAIGCPFHSHPSQSVFFRRSPGGEPELVY